MLLTCLCLFAVISAPGVFWAAIKRARFEETLPFAVFAAVTVMYLFGLLGALRAGVYAVLALAALLYAAAAVTAFKNKTWRELGKRLATPGFVFFVLCFALLVLANKGKQAYRIDEFTNWMDVVKAMTQVDDFGLNPRAYCAFASYPPGMAVWQYFAQVVSQLCGGGAFVEWLAYLMYQLALISLFFPFATELEWKPTAKLAVLALAALGLPLVFLPITIT